jgi:hypothetical protein
MASAFHSHNLLLTTNPLMKKGALETKSWAKSFLSTELSFCQGITGRDPQGVSRHATNHCDMDFVDAQNCHLHIDRAIKLKGKIYQSQS